MEKMNWKAVLISAVLLLIIPIIVQLIIGFGYSFAVGFQTRGDMDEVQRLSQAFSASIPFLVLTWLVMGGVAFWRGRKMLTAVPGAAVVNILAAGVIAMLLSSAMNLGSRGSEALLLVVVAWVVVLAGGFLGASAGGEQTASQA